MTDAWFTARRVTTRRLAVPLPVAVVALVGAWLGHFFEYVRVAGLDAAVRQMGSSVHVYFFPAGLAILVLAALGGALLGRAWAALGRRLRDARVAVWADRSQPRQVLPPSSVSTGWSFGRLWMVLTVLQLATWVLQENLEALAAGAHPPVLGVLGGAHALVPLIEAEIALSGAALYWIIQKCWRRREELAVVAERFVARRWARAARGRALPPVEPARVWSPLERWGAQRWQRPPPMAARPPIPA